MEGLFDEVRLENTGLREVRELSLLAAGIPEFSRHMGNSWKVEALGFLSSLMLPGEENHTVYLSQMLWCNASIEAAEGRKGLFWLTIRGVVYHGREVEAVEA